MVKVQKAARIGLARRAQGARRRRCRDIVDDEQRSDRRATPMRLGLRTQIPSGSGFARASAALPLLDDVPASPPPRALCARRARCIPPPHGGSILNLRLGFGESGYATIGMQNRLFESCPRTLTVFPRTSMSMCHTRCRAAIPSASDI